MNENSSTALINNCILWDGNTTRPEVNDDASGTYSVKYCDIEGGVSFGATNIDTDPLFVNPAVGDFRLQATSPCIDTGFNFVGIPLIDIDGNPRIADGDGDCVYDIDMGAAEYQLADSDADGFHDICDNCPYIFNSDQANQDADGVGDVCDNCVRVANAGQENTYGNALGDACEPHYTETISITGPFTPDGPIPVETCFTFNGYDPQNLNETIDTIAVDCFNTYHILIDPGTGTPYYPRYQVRFAYALTDDGLDDTVTYPEGVPQCITCDISKKFNPAVFTAPETGTAVYTVEAVYSNFIDAFSGHPRYPLWNGWVPSAASSVTLANLLTVGIDIKPGAYPNTVNLGSNGKVPVAILSSSTFDATTVDPESVTLADAGVIKKIKGKGTKYMASTEDVNEDGLPDLVVHVETQSFLLTQGDEAATLKGQTFAGVNIEGVDTIRVIP
jgi:hypothetical protein